MAEKGLLMKIDIELMKDGDTVVLSNGKTGVSLYLPGLERNTRVAILAMVAPKVEKKVEKKKEKKPEAPVE